jgi:poly(A) polymerase
MCATHNITHSTKEVILKELARGGDIANNIADGKATWKDLFTKHTFFTKDYKYYLSIVSGGRTKTAQKEWSGLVESKVRRLVSGIEMSDSTVHCARPYNKGFDRIHECNSEKDIDEIFQGSVKFQITEEKAIELEKSAAADDKAQNGSKPILVYTTTYYLGLDLGETDGMSGQHSIVC